MDIPIDAIFLFVGILAIWSAFGIVCYLGSRSKLGRNAYAGIRLPSTMVNDSTWETAHKEAMWHVKMSGISIFPLAVVAVVAFNGSKVLIGILATLYAVCLTWIIVATVMATKAAKRALSSAIQN
ncbi:MAG: SdpI family protein [Propionibacteriaceae bacterium]|jgi:hypothetical protein|nr:SdpI family protein [Propionibacteriaceae bacterium]